MTASPAGKFVAAIVTAAAGSVHAEVAPELGGEQAAAELEAGVEAWRQQRQEDQT